MRADEEQGWKGVLLTLAQREEEQHPQKEHP